MIRRWSYINSINSLNPRFVSNPADVSRAAFDLNVNSTMYLYKYYSPATRISRRRWARRRHIYNLIPLTNIISRWAKYYRTTRNHSKSIIYQDFFGHSFVAFNFVSVMNSVPAIHRGLENVITSPLTRRMLSHFRVYGNPRLKFILKQKNLALSLISIYNLEKNFTKLEDTRAAGPLLYDGRTSFMSWDEITPSHKFNYAELWNSILHLCWEQAVAQVVALYKTLVLLSYTRIYHNR